MNGEFDHGKFQGMVLAKLSAIHEDLSTLANKVEKQEDRIRSLEGWRWWFMGALALGGIGSFASIAKAFM